MGSGNNALASKSSRFDEPVKIKELNPLPLGLLYIFQQTGYYYFFHCFSSEGLVNLF